MTWVCIASGPSLTAEDIETVRLSGLPTVAVNSTWEKVRFCSVIYAGDGSWWSRNHHKIDIDAERWGCSHNVRQHGVNHHRVASGPYNSGLRAIQFAATRDDRIILLGYDCQPTGGRLHHHPDHEHKNPSHRSFRAWLGQFGSYAKVAERRGIQIVNCTRETALDCWPRMELGEALESLGT